MSNGFSASRAVPSAYAVLSFIGVLVIARISESLYVAGHVLAIVSALAAAVSFFALKNTREERRKRFMFGVGLFGVLSAATGALPLSFGSTASASGDIGGFLMWLASTVGLLLMLMVSATERNAQPAHWLNHTGPKVDCLDNQENRNVSALCGPTDVGPFLHSQRTLGFLAVALMHCLPAHAKAQRYGLPGESFGSGSTHQHCFTLARLTLSCGQCAELIKHPALVLAKFRLSHALSPLPSLSM